MRILGGRFVCSSRRENTILSRRVCYQINIAVKITGFDTAAEQMTNVWLIKHPALVTQSPADAL